MSGTEVATTTSTPPELLATNENTSVLLRRVLAQLPGPDVRIGYVILQLRRRSFGGLLIILGAVNLLPGVSLFSGFATIVPGLQMAAGFRAPLLPRFIRRRRVDVDDLRALGEKLVRVIEWVERFVRPRWLLLSTPPMIVIVGVLVTALAVVVMLPLPLSNFPPAVALILLSLGIMERDGLLIVIGLFAAAVALVIGALISYFALHSLLPLVQKYFF